MFLEYQKVTEKLKKPYMVSRLPKDSTLMYTHIKSWRVQSSELDAPNILRYAVFLFLKFYAHLYSYLITADLNFYTPIGYYSSMVFRTIYTFCIFSFY